MSKGGHGAAAASVLMLKKSEDKRQESALREAFKVRDSSNVNHIPKQNIMCIILQGYMYGCISL